MENNKSTRCLHLVGYILVWAEALLGVVLFKNCVTTLAHGLFLAILLAATLCVLLAAKRRAARVTARVLTGVFWVWLALVAVQTVNTMMGAWYGGYIASLQQAIAIVGAPLLCYLAPAAVTVMLYCGENTAGYDRLVGCVILPAQILTAYVALYTGADIPWTPDGTVLPTVWLVLLAVTTLAVWVCAAKRTEAQQSVIERRRARREEKRAAHEAKLALRRGE